VSLLTIISILISIFPISALHPTFISVLSVIFALFLTQKLPRLPSLCYCRFQIRLCQFHSYWHFFSQYLRRVQNYFGTSRYSLNCQHHPSSKFTLLLLPLMVFEMVALLFGFPSFSLEFFRIPSLIISDLPTLTLSNPLRSPTLLQCIWNVHHIFWTFHTKK